MNKIQGLAPINGSISKDGKLGVKDQVETAAKPVQGEIERDDLVLTEAAQQLGKAAEMQQQVPDMDAGKVEAIRAQIANGEYQMSASRIARGFIEMEKLT